jgi:hypothetical protein
MRGEIMKQIVSFKKDILFPTRIAEITSISLEHSLKLVEKDHIMGEFNVNGNYKITNISINVEPFSYNLPFDIALDTKYDAENSKVDIDDFYYEILNDQTMVVNIDVLIDGIEVVENETMKEEYAEVESNEEILDEFTPDLNEEEIIDIRASNDYEDKEIMNLFKEIEEPPIDVTIENTKADEKIKSLFDSFDDKSESFTTYYVHIVRENDTIDSIITKYKTTKEELLQYNKIDELKLGDKIIIPEPTNE